MLRFVNISREDIKICKECLHSYTLHMGRPLYKCRMYVDIVSGEPCDADIARADESLCGIAGKGWESKGDVEN